MSETERYYDEHLGPKLAALGREAREHGMSFLAFVEYEPECIAETQAILPPESLAMSMLRYCARNGTNVDSYIIAVARHCEREGIDTSRSIVLSHSCPSENSKP